MARDPVLITPLSQHSLDETKLFAQLAAELPEFEQPAQVRQFQGGQSNPTYLIETAQRSFVLRKKPPGQLLPSAHMIEREFRVMAALEGRLPVPQVRFLCEDPQVIGSAFYVMDHVDGRVMFDTTLAEEPAGERRSIYRSLATTLAQLHSIDPREVGLGDFGRPDNYVGRQIDRWTRQYQAARTDEIAAMDRLMAWLPEYAPKADETAIVHGDFRLGNMIYAEKGSEILAVLDWELSTLGHPLSDLAYAALPWSLPLGGPMPGLFGADLDAMALPSEDEFLGVYAKAVGRTEIPDWPFFLALSLFRLAGITQGVYARSLAGNAADSSASRMHRVARGAAELGWAIASGARSET